MRTLRRGTRLSGVRAASRELAKELYFAAQDVPNRLRTRELPDAPLKLHIGCGNRIREGWLNIDLSHEADLRVDLREPLPLADGCAELIHAEHFFEHLEHPRETSRFLSECHRVLQPGGTLSLGVPDAEIALRAYTGDRDWLYYAIRRWPPLRGTYIETPIGIINLAFRQGGEHKFAYDAETLLLILTQAGFEDAHVREADEELDTPERVEGSLLVSATRPW